LQGASTQERAFEDPLRYRLQMDISLATDAVLSVACPEQCRRVEGGHIPKGQEERRGMRRQKSGDRSQKASD